MRGSACNPHRRGLVEHVLTALVPGLADPAAVSRIAREVEQFDSHSLEAAASAADMVFNVAADDGRGAFEGDPDFVQGAREDAMADLRRVVEAGRLRAEERREHGARGVATRITEDGLMGWRISRRPTTRPGQLARPRARRSSPGRRRGSRRGTGSGSRTGSGDDPDDGGEPEPARGGRLGRSSGRGRRRSARRRRGGAA